MDTKQILREYITTELMTGPHAGEVRDDESLLTNKIIDSLGVMRLVAFVEERFGVSVADEDVTLKNFESIQAIHDYVQRQAGNGAAA
jgi:acyl carrier protein